MAKVVKEDTLNSYFTNVLNHLLTQLELEEIQPNELQDLSIFSKYQGTNRPETTVYIMAKKNRMLSLEFKKGNITSSGWRGL